MASRIAEKLAAKKAAIYIRVSTHWQVDKDSLKVQRRELIAYVTLVLGITDYVVFEDPGYSAKNTDRPEYQAMMDRIRTGEFTHLVVWKIDRISRNLIDFAAMHDELQSLGVTFVSKNEQFDTSSAIGEAMMRIILIFAELERKTTAERVTPQTANGTAAASPSAIRGRRKRRLSPSFPKRPRPSAAWPNCTSSTSHCSMSPSTSTTPVSSRRRAANGHRPRYAPS